MKKEFWDFDENKNYRTVNIQNKNYKVIDKYSDYYTAATILSKIDSIILQMCIYLKKNYKRYTQQNRVYIDCFCDIHPNNYLLSEMQLDTMFEGINKPRDVHKSDKIGIGKDGKLRSKWRHIFLTLRTNTGQFKTQKDIMWLVIHELAHTMCNHVQWHDDNHGKDFQNAEKILYKAYYAVT